MTPPSVCEPVKAPSASVVTYQCRDGRTCGDPRLEPDGGPGDPYQICPGTNGCATLVKVDGTSMGGYC